MRFTDGWAALLQSVVPLASALLGFVAAATLDRKKDERQLALIEQQEVASLTRSRVERADAFELEVLRDLFTTLHARFRLQGGHYVAYRRALKEHPDAIPLQVAHEPYDGEEARMLQAELVRLAWLVLDDDLRDQVERTCDRMTAYLVAQSPDEADQLAQSSSAMATETLRAVARRMRELHRPSD